MVISHLTNVGTKHVILGDYAEARNTAYLANSFEQFIGFIQNGWVPNLTTCKELLQADEHSLVRFFQKRIPCDCLDEKYANVKCIPKMGLCDNVKCGLTGRIAVRSEMLCCSRCKKANYCSTKCQEKDWKRHKEWCRSFSFTGAMANATVKK